MDKKELKFYEAPASEVVEIKLQGMLCVSEGSLDDPNKDSEELGDGD